MKIVLISLLICMAASCHQKQASIKVPAVTKPHRIAFLLYDDFDTVLLHTAVNEATVFYNCSATVLPSQSLPAFAFYTSRQRYKADSLLKFQTSLLPPGCETVI